MHRSQLDRLAEALVDRETLDEREILNVTGLPRAPVLDETKPAAAATSVARVGR
jgi:cell division protease FtsH